MSQGNNMYVNFVFGGLNLITKYLLAFIIGGIICLIGQLLIDYTRLTPARILVSYVVSGVILTGLKIYDPIVKLGGAGATVPLTGFGYSLAKGVEEAVNKDGLLGTLTGGLTATAAGITAVLLFAVIFALVSKPKMK